MEKVKEESRRKSEELEMLKRSVAERSLIAHQDSEPVYHSKQTSSDYDDFIMDFSKPAGYKPPTEPVREPARKPVRPLFENSDVVVRRRSLEPQAVESVKPPVPSNPPPRRASRESSQGRPAPPAVPPPPPQPSMERQHSQLMEEIRRSASQRMMRVSEE